MKKILLLIITLIFVSCKTQNLLTSSTKASPTTSYINPRYEYKIQRGDKLNISVWGEDELSVGSIYGIYNSNEVYGKWLMVDVNGFIAIPQIGNKFVLGKTILEMKDELSKEFKSLLNKPIVDVKILNKEIVVLGEVRNPGNFTIDTEEVDLLKIIGKTGGFEFYADLKAVKILRNQNNNYEPIVLNLSKEISLSNQNIKLYPGDVVIIPSRKNKEFDKRISTIIPFTTAISAIAILLGLF